MEEYVNILRSYLDTRRNFRRKVYRIVATLYRGVTNGRFTYEQGLNAINRMKNSQKVKEE